MRHDLKTWLEPFAAIADDKKFHEIRKESDRSFRVGEVLLLREWDENKKQYTGRAIEADITYLTRGPDWDVPVGLVVMSLGQISSVFYHPPVSTPYEADVMRDMLLSLGVDVPLSTVDNWSADQKLSADTWASAALANISKDPNIVVPPTPPHVEQWVKKDGQ